MFYALLNRLWQEHELSLSSLFGIPTATTCAGQRADCQHRSRGSDGATYRAFLSLRKALDLVHKGPTGCSKRVVQLSPWVPELQSSLRLEWADETSGSQGSWGNSNSSWSRKGGGRGRQTYSYAHMHPHAPGVALSLSLAHSRLHGTPPPSLWL